MKYVKVLASLMLMFMVCSAFTSNDKGKGMYIVGVSASFTDSLIYFTDIQFVDSVEVDKNGFLPMRDQYSDQLEIYLEHKMGMKDLTCFIYFNEKKTKLEKTIKKMKEKYQKSGTSILRETGEDFKFTKAVEY